MPSVANMIYGTVDESDVYKNLMGNPVVTWSFEQAQKNIYLEEKMQVLQQQNEDLKARIDRNTALSR